MRTSCFFVSVAIIIAQQASAAPILGLTTLPVIEDHGDVAGSLSNTLQTVPLVGSLTNNVLKSNSEGHLLSTTELAGGDLGLPLNILKRAEGIPLVGSLPGLSMLGGSSGSSGASSMPGLSSLSSMPGLSALSSMPGLSTLPSMPGLSTLPSMPGLSTLTSMPGLNQFSSLGGMQGMNPFGGLTSALPLGGLMKRNFDIGSLPLIDSLPVVGSMTSSPALSSLPLIPSSTSMPSGTSANVLGPMSSVLTPFVSGLTNSSA